MDGSLHATTSTDIADALDQMLCETIVETAKAQNFHWNVRGVNFQSLHSLFEEIYDDHFDAQDEIAERIRAIGEFVDPGLRRAVDKSDILEPDGVLSSLEMLESLAHDQRLLSASCVRTARVAEDAGDLATNDFSIGRAATHDKFSWMLSAHLESA